MAQDETKRYYSTPALEKGLDILELFAGTPEGFNVSEVARRLNRTVSEIFRMLLCLEKRGYLVQSANKDGYHLTLRLFRLAQEHPPTKRMVTEAMPIMHWLAHELRQSCHLGVLDRGHRVTLAPDARGGAIQEWAQETKRKKPADLEAHLARIRKLGHERRASYEVRGV